MEKLAAYLAKHGLTQQAFADTVSVSQPTVNRWLRGEGRPSWETARKISDVTKGMVPVSAWVDAPLSEAS